MTISFWIYDPTTNEAIEINNPEDVDFDTFRVEERGVFTYVQATDSESMEMKRVTPEQIVILFATIRGLRNAAMEEDQDV